MAAGSKPPVRRYLRYWFDRLISKGLPGLLILSFLGAVLLLLVATPLILLLDSIGSGIADVGSFFGIYWAGFLSLFKAGAPEGPWQDQVARLVFAIIALFFTGAILGTVIRSLRDKVHDLEEKGGEVIADDHTIILGWSPLGFRVIDELAIANSGRRHPWILILSPERKSALEAELSDQAKPQGTRLAVRSIPHVDTGHLDLVRGATARSVIVLGRWGTAKHDPDVVANLLLLARYRELHPDHVPTVVAGVVSSRNLGPARTAAGRDAVIVPLAETASRMMFQVARQQGMIQVVTSLLSFEPHTIRVLRRPDLAGHSFGEVVVGLSGATPLAIRRDGRITVLPDLRSVVTETDELLVLAERGSDIRLQPVPFARTESLTEDPAAPTRPERWVHLGWTADTPDIIALHDASAGGPDHVLLVVRPEDAESAGRLAEQVRSNLTLDVVTWPRDQPVGDVVGEAVLRSADRILIFVQRDPDGRPNDAATLLVRLQVMDELGADVRSRVVITELMEERYRTISAASDARDMLVGSEVVARLLAQLSEQPLLLGLYNDLLGPGGPQVMLRPVADYPEVGPDDVFEAFVQAAARRGEIAIGYRVTKQADDRDSNFGVVLNPPRAAGPGLTGQDSIVVIGRPHRQASGHDVVGSGAAVPD